MGGSKCQHDDLPVGVQLWDRGHNFTYGFTLNIDIEEFKKANPHESGDKALDIRLSSEISKTIALGYLQEHLENIVGGLSPEEILNLYAILHIYRKQEKEK